jgi:hypothetical protein
METEAMARFHQDLHGGGEKFVPRVHAGLLRAGGAAHLLLFGVLLDFPMTSSE